MQNAKNPSTLVQRFALGGMELAGAGLLLKVNPSLASKLAKDGGARTVDQFIDVLTDYLGSREAARRSLAHTQRLLDEIHIAVLRGLTALGVLGSGLVLLIGSFIGQWARQKSQ